MPCGFPHAEQQRGAEGVPAAGARAGSALLRDRRRRSTDHRIVGTWRRRAERGLGSSVGRPPRGGRQCHGAHGQSMAHAARAFSRVGKREKRGDGHSRRVRGDDRSHQQKSGRGPDGVRGGGPEGVARDAPPRRRSSTAGGHTTLHGASAKHRGRGSRSRSRRRRPRGAD